MNNIIYIIENDINTKIKIDLKKDNIIIKNKKILEESKNLFITKNKKFMFDKKSRNNIRYKQKSNPITYNNIIQQYILKFLGMYSINNYYSTDVNKLDDYKITNLDIKITYDKNGLYKNLYYNTLTIINNSNINILEIKENLINKQILYFIYNIFNILEINGNIFIKLKQNFLEQESYNIIYLLSYLFKKIIIVNISNLYCLGFNKNIINKSDIENIINNNFIFTINPKKDIDNFLKYLYENVNIRNKMHKELYLGNETIGLKLEHDRLIQLIQQLGINDQTLLQDLDLHYIDKFKIIFNGKDKKIIKIDSSIKSFEGKYISDIIKKYNFKKCLEIGFANGVSAVYILKNINTSLISIDPFQKTQWKDNGRKLVKNLKLNTRHKCIEKKSYEALPELLKKDGNNSFDFIFIDGWHTFDYTLVDFFYSNLLLKIGGIIIIDDALHAGVADCVKYLNSNYKFYEKLVSPNTIASYKKIKDDDREWNFHVKI